MTNENWVCIADIVQHLVERNIGGQGINDGQRCLIAAVETHKVSYASANVISELHGLGLKWESGETARHIQNKADDHKERADKMLAHIEKVDRQLVIRIEYMEENEGKLTLSAVSSLCAAERKMAFQEALQLLRKTKP